MPTTVELIGEMTDEGKFEKLALAVLRRMKPDECAALIHNGVNAKGETVPSLVDAEGVVPGSKPPRYVIIQFTKTKRRELKRKWLFNHLDIESCKDSTKPGPKRQKPSEPKDDGDLFKAIRRSREKHSELPDASFKVYLVTNLHGVDELLTSVTATGIQADVETEIVDAGRLADFLDNDPQGQPIRFNFFMTPVTHMSPDWLVEMGHTSLLQRQSRPDFETATKRVSRACAADLQEAFATPSTALVWVVATPGKGKSVVAVDAASAHLQDGGFALWLSEQDVNDAESPWEAVDSALRRDCRTLEAEAGKQTLRLATNSRRLVLLIDDLNRLQNPEDAFRKVRNWVRRASTPADNEKDQGGSGSSFVFVCPIWPQHLDKLDKSRAVPSERPSWEETFEVPKFSESETTSIFSGTNLTALEVQAIADELDFDPLLCSLAAERIRGERTAKPDATRGIIRWYLEQQVKRVVDKTGRPASEYLGAVQRLAEAMLRAKNLRPKWSYVQAWISDTGTLERLAELFKERAVIYCEAVSETVLFNHDRFLDAMCAGSIPDLIGETDVCGDPYFAEIIGRAIADDKLSEGQINQILCINPLAAFCGLMFATNEAVKQKLSPLLIRWAQEQGCDKNLPSRLLFEIALKLLKTDSPSVVEFPCRLPEVWGLDLAALRNGSANYGANYCRSYERRYFMPRLRDSRRDAIMDHARANHAASLVTDLNRDLKQPGLPVEYQNACLILAGFLHLEELTVGIELCWKNCPPNERPEIIASAVWAIVRCAHQRFAELLPLVFEVWQTIPDEGARERDHPRSNIAFYDLGHCPPQWMSETVVQWLISVLPSYPGLKASLDYLLSGADTPSAFEYQVRRLAAKKLEKGGDFSLYFFIDRRWDPADKHGYRISESSRDRLSAIWSNSQEPIEDRECALRFWLFSATVSDLTVLRSIKSGSPLYPFALKKRMQLRDRTTVAELPEALRQSWWLLQDVPAIWSPEIHGAVIEALRAQHGYFHHDEDGVAGLLLSLPEVAAEKLLTELWPEWGNELGFQAAALLLGTNKTKALVASALNDPKTCGAILELAKFVMMVTRPYLNREDLLPQWLDHYTPYLHHASQETLRRLELLRHSPLTWKWHEQHVVPLLRPESRTELDERMELQNLEKNYRRNPDLYYGAHRFFEHLEQTGLDKNEILRRIAGEAHITPTVENMNWLAACIAVAGDRKDISLLNEEFTGTPADLLTKLRTDCAFSVMRRSLV